MKRLAAFLLVMALVPVTAALADHSVTLFTNAWGTTVNTVGIYTTLSIEEAAIWTGPGYDYENMGGWLWEGQSVRCISLASDRSGNTWVLIDYTDRWGDINRGYLPLSDFPGESRRNLVNALPWECTYDELTPMMAAQLYTSCTGYWGPGTYYPEKMFLDSRNCEGTLMMKDGDWVLMELNDETTAAAGCYGRVRVWIQERDCFY